MKTTCKLSALALVIALTACSSSNSNSPSALVDKAKDTVAKVEDTAKDAVAKTEETVKDVSNDTPKAVENATNKVTEETKVETTQAGSYWLFDEAINSDRSYIDNFDTANGNTLVIDGKTFQLSTFDKNADSKLPNSYFGYGVNNFGVNGKESIVVYSYGTLTNVDKVPQSGTATYKGDAMYGSEAIEGVFTTEAKSELSVDFGQKTVDGRIYHTGLNINDTLPTATITGNSFAGQAINEANKHIRVRGHFFGTNAEEIGGVLDNDGKVASFGATKQ